MKFTLIIGIFSGAVSTGNIGKMYRSEKEKELGRAPSMANCLSTTVPVNLAAAQIAGRHTPTRNSLRHSRMIVLHRTGNCKFHYFFHKFRKKICHSKIIRKQFFITKRNSKIIIKKKFHHKKNSPFKNNINNFITKRIHHSKIIIFQLKKKLLKN